MIRETCSPIHLSEWLGDEGSLSDRPVLVTFDDGYRSVFTLAKPILERYRVPAVLFVTTRPAIERRRFWYDQMALDLGESAVEHAKSSSHVVWSRLLCSSRRPSLKMTLTLHDEQGTPRACRASTLRVSEDTRPRIRIRLGRSPTFRGTRLRRTEKSTRSHDRRPSNCLRLSQRQAPA